MDTDREAHRWAQILLRSSVLIGVNRWLRVVSDKA